MDAYLYFRRPTSYKDLVSAKSVVERNKTPETLYKTHLRAYQYRLACLVQVIFIFGGTDRSSSERAQTPPKKRHEAKPWPKSCYHLEGYHLGNLRHGGTSLDDEEKSRKRTG